MDSHANKNNNGRFVLTKIFNHLAIEPESSLAPEIDINFMATTYI
jgi:hypothetical protein